MRSWAAIFAALLILILTASAVSISFVAAADSLNKASRSAIDELCGSIGLDSEAMTRQERIDLLHFLEPELLKPYCLLDGDHGVLVESKNKVVLPQKTDLLDGFTKHTVFNAKGSDGEEKIYAIYPYQNGDILLFSAQMETWMSVAHGNALTMYLLLIGLVAAGILIYICISMRNRQLAMSRTMRTLDAIADGDYDARVEMLPGESETINEYNATLDRLQNRIFKQRNRNRALSVIINQMQNGIIAVDQDCNVLLVTPKAKEMFGIMGNPEGKHVDEITKDVHLEAVFQEAMQHIGVYTNDVVARAAVGRGHRPLRLYVSPMRNGDELVGALAMVEDISELKRLEDMRTDFAANVSHELKTPLTSIRGFVETLEAGAIEKPDMARKFLRIIAMETERLTRLINDILSISKLESGKDEVTVDRIRVDKMADDICEMLSINASEKQVDVIFQKPAKPVYILGNSDRVEQMLINIIENGIKYNKPGGLVRVQVFESGDMANISVADTGIGIAEEHQPRLFERFYRVDKGRSREMGGTGLGLAIVKHIVKSMGGEIEVNSKLGEGTEFLITLPLYRQGAEGSETSEMD